MKELQRKGKTLDDLMIKAMDRTTRILRRKVIEKHFSNTTAPSARAVRKQSGKLQRSITFSRAISVGGKVSANLRIGTKYGGIHVAKNKRTKTTISGRPFLAIPTRFARDARGVPLAPPLDPRWKPTRIVNGIIFGQLGGSSVPLFTLRRSVEVPQRVSMERDVIKPGKQILIQQLSVEIKKVL